MHRTVETAGTLALTTGAAAMVLACVARSGNRAVLSPLGPGTGVPAAVALVAIGYVAVGESRRVLAAADRPTLTVADGWTFLSVVAAAPVTRWLAVDAGLGVVVGAALVGLVAHLIVPDYGVPAYCGTFVGMASPAVLPGYALVTAAAAVAGVVFLATKRTFNGFGGKLGTTAFVGCLAVAGVNGVEPATATTPTHETAVPVLATCVAAAVVTFALSIRFDHGPVVGSAVVGLVVGLVCPPLAPAGGRLAAAGFCASFAGMSRPDRLPDETGLAAAGLLTGAVFLAATQAFVGFGGKLGTVAFVACLGTRGLLSAAERVRAVADVPAAG